MRTIVCVTLAFDILVNFIYFTYCRRLLPVMTMLLLVTELMHCITGTVRTSKDRLLTNIYILAITGLILITGITAYNFVSKPETPYLLNGGATLWDTQTEKLADEICVINTRITFTFVLITHRNNQKELFLFVCPMAGNAALGKFAVSH